MELPLSTENGILCLVLNVPQRFPLDGPSAVVVFDVEVPMDIGPDELYVGVCDRGVLTLRDDCFELLQKGSLSLHF